MIQTTWKPDAALCNYQSHPRTSFQLRLHLTSSKTSEKLNSSKQKQFKRESKF